MMAPSPAPREREGPSPQGWEGEGSHKTVAAETLTRLASFATLSRGAGEGLSTLLGQAMVLLILVVAASPAAAAPMPIRVVVVTMFEIGGDSGDTPGEFQGWGERLPLDETLDFPQGYRALRLNREKGVLGLVTGIGTAHAAASIM